MKIFNNHDHRERSFDIFHPFSADKSFTNSSLIDARHGIRPMRLGATSEIVYPCSHQSDKKFYQSHPQWMVATRHAHVQQGFCAELNL
jgi:hypothetical protein